MAKRTESNVSSESKPVPKAPETLQCRVCLKELPDAATMSTEAAEYAQHYCGIECYQTWLADQESSADKQ